MRDRRARPLRRVVRLVVLAAVERGLGSLDGVWCCVWRERAEGGLCLCFSLSLSCLSCQRHRHLAGFASRAEQEQEQEQEQEHPLHHLYLLSPNSRGCQFTVWKCGILRLRVGWVGHRIHRIVTIFSPYKASSRYSIHRSAEEEEEEGANTTFRMDTGSNTRPS